MTRKDFQLIADAIQSVCNGIEAGVPFVNDVQTEDRESVRMYLATQFANTLASTNDRFDRERFIKACAK